MLRNRNFKGYDHGIWSKIHRFTENSTNKNYYVVRNAGCTRSRYTMKLSLIFFKSMDQLINRVYLERLIRR